MTHMDVKGRSNAFIFFLEFRIKENKRQNKTDYKNIAKFSKSCSELWNSMTDDKKKKFKIMEEYDKRRFNVEKKIIRRKRMKEKVNMPKKPKSAVFFYKDSIKNEQQAENPSVKLKPSDSLKNAVERFKSLTEKDKGKFIDMAEKDSKRYKQEMSVYYRRYPNKKAEKKVPVSVPIDKIRSKEFVCDYDSDSN